MQRAAPLLLLLVLLGCRAEPPSTFEVTILPPVPEPSDTLTAVRLEESTAATTVEYLHRWYVDGDYREDLTGEIILASETEAGQVWRVTVIPVTDGVEGPPALAEVTIGETVLPDEDGDGYDVSEDCDDNDELVHPGATEECDGDDEDCDEEIDEGFDVDGDGVTTCEGDCDDGDAAILPGADEFCNGIDDDCQNGPDFDGSGEVDADADGFLSCEECDDDDAALTPEDADGDGISTCDGDCDDTDAAITPLDGDGDGASLCDGDCDDTDASLNIDDLDNDGVSTCDEDCDDLDSLVRPDATELCNGFDDDCGGDIDEGFDFDSDGFTTCGADGVVGNADDDCDDGDGSITPADADTDGFSVCGPDGVLGTADDDCDDSDDEVGPFDNDGDGVEGCSGDCDDGNYLTYPGSNEICDGDDQDCDGVVDEGFDGDGDGATACGPDGNYGSADDDCDDGDATIYPTAPELCDGIDNDCDPASAPLGGDEDGDGDGVLGCADCDDADPDTYPGGPEICDGVADNNCDGLPVTEDVDLDGDGWTPCLGDCDEGDAGRNPDALEVGDSIDQDCDGIVDEGTDVYDDDGDGLTEQDGDCDDTSVDVYPGAPEVCDGIADNSCDGLLDPTDEDADSDGVSTCQGDCDDAEPLSFPGNPEVCTDTVDNDCDGVALDCGDLDGDLDGWTPNQGDCDDEAPAIYPGAPDTPPDGIDQDCDGDPDGPDTWSFLALYGDTLPPTTGAAATYDDVWSRLLVFGGQTYNDVLDGVFMVDPSGAVTELLPTGTGPGPRYGHKAALDAQRGRVIVVGGQGPHALYDEVWSLDLASFDGTWEQLTPQGDPLPPLLGHSLHYDTANDRLVLYGGQSYGQLLGSVWTLSFASDSDGIWEELVVPGTPPLARATHGAAWDDDGQRLFIGGGRVAHDVPSDLYVWQAQAGPVGTWTLLNPDMGAPDGGAAPGWFWDPIAGRIVSVGGRVPNDLLLEPQSVSFNEGLPGDWFGLAPAGTEPPAFTASAVVYDPVGYGLWMVGGTARHQLIDGIWRLDF